MGLMLGVGLFVAVFVAFFIIGHIFQSIGDTISKHKNPEVWRAADQFF